MGHVENPPSLLSSPITMTKKERFHATIERKPVDRPSSWLGIPATAAMPALLDHFGATDLTGLKNAIGDDVWPVELP